MAPIVRLKLGHLPASQRGSEIAFQDADYISLRLASSQESPHLPSPGGNEVA